MLNNDKQSCHVVADGMVFIPVVIVVSTQLRHHCAAAGQVLLWGREFVFGGLGFRQVLT